MTAAKGDEWFDGPAGRTEEERAFLDALRAAAAGSSWGITPDDTTSMLFDVPLYLAVDIPAMATFPGTRAARQLELAPGPRTRIRVCASTVFGGTAIRR